MTQGDLGRLLGLSQETITNYERGGRFPRPRALQAIALRLGLSYDELLGPHEPGAAVSAAAAGPALAVSAEETDFNKHALPDALDLSIERFLEVARREPIEEIFAYSSAWKRARGSSLAQHYHTALMPLLARIGLEWQKGALSVADEHLISHRLREVAVLHARAERPSAAAHSRKARRWMGLCAPGEQHDLALFMHSLALRQAGWSTLYLATQVPISDLLGAIREYRPQVLGISVTMAENVEGLRLYARQVREVFTQDPAGRPAMIAGGQGLSRVEDSLAEEVDAISVSLVEGIELAEGFVHSE